MPKHGGMQYMECICAHLDLVTIWNRAVTLGPLPLNRRQSLWWDAAWVTVGLDATMNTEIISDVDRTE